LRITYYHPAMEPSRVGALHWWQTRRGVAALALLCALPLLWPTIPPLVDLPGHMAAYKVELDLARSPDLQRYYSLHWALIGNLGLNLLVIPLSKAFGLELAVKLVMIAVPPMTAAGFLWVAREVHGRVPASALFALPFAYAYPFTFGFANFVLSMGLCFLAFALWLRMGRLERKRLRALAFVPLAVLVWLAHTFGWGVFGILAFSAETVRELDRGRRLREAALRAGVQCLSLVVPLLMMLVWRSGDVAGKTEHWLAIVPKVNYLLYALRDRWQWIDVPSVLLVLGLIAWAIRSRRFGFSRNLAASALVLIAIYLALPQKIFGSSYADMRLLPYTIALAILAIRPKEEVRWLALAGLAFFGVRIAAETASFALYGAAFDRELAALDHVPKGARLISLIGTPCRGEWTMTRFDHLSGLAVVRREAYSNDQWSVAGAQLDRSEYYAAGAFRRDPSQIVRLHDCPVNRWPTLDASLRHFPREAFDYLWLINPPGWDRSLTAGMVPVWTNGRSVLFRIVDRTQPVIRSTDTLPVAEP
jgi:hypothetical protein